MAGPGSHQLFARPCARHTNVRSASRPKSRCERAEERFRIVAHASNDVVWEWEVQNDKVTFSENFKAIYGHGVDRRGNLLQALV